jgi:hypothetical protein
MNFFKIDTFMNIDRIGEQRRLEFCNHGGVRGGGSI